MSHVLVTGGAGFIGSHLTRSLLDAGFSVRVLDCLERPSHTSDQPTHLDRRAEFLRGDVRKVTDLRRALDGIDTVCHLAATGGFTSKLTQYLRTNSLGTALLLETIRKSRFPIERILVASSMAVYGEGSGRCGQHGKVRPRARTVDRLARGNYEPVCPRCGADVGPEATDEEEAVAPERPYSISKFDQERLVLSLAGEIGYQAAALRFFVTYGPGQSLTNPYTGVISIFANRIANGHRPMVYEDGAQTRDFVYVGDVVAAHLHLLQMAQLDGRVYNVGSSQSTSLTQLANIVAKAMGSDLEPQLPGRYRLGDVRHIRADIDRLTRLGWRPRVGLAEGIGRYVDWFRENGHRRDTFADADRSLRRTGLIREATADV